MFIIQESVQLKITRTTLYFMGKNTGKNDDVPLPDLGKIYSPMISLSHGTTARDQERLYNPRLTKSLEGFTDGRGVGIFHG
jgi:hypothetical protein